MSTEETKKYEIGYLISPLVPADKLDGVIASEISSFIESEGGLITGHHSSEMKTLAYPIKKPLGNKKTTFKEAYFGCLYFALEPEKVVKLKEKLNKSEAIIRFIVLSFVKEKEKPVRLEKKDLAEESLVKPKPISIKKELNKEKIDQEIENLLTSV